jgi:hypothetical protein
LSSASIKQNSTHRKNKTTLIGQNMGVNSSSAFVHPANLLAAETQPSSTMKKIISGTVSHKSLRSTSSRKRVASIDSS